jgi:hypothetical protein
VFVAIQLPLPHPTLFDKLAFSLMAASFFSHAPI